MNNYKKSWQRALSDLITDPRELIQILELSDCFLEKSLEVAQLFPLRVPRQFLNRIKKGDPNDPLLMQILPLSIELLEKAGFTTDPLLEAEMNPIPGLIHKYHGRVLLTMTGSCAVHCRYCFRKFFPYQANVIGRKRWLPIINYINQDVSIQEVILSGGDPLSLNNQLLKEFFLSLETIPHLTTIRIHSRLPIFIPERIDDELLESFNSLGRLKKIMVIHTNHPNEINDEVGRALKALKACGVMCLNQSVLLKGINSDPNTLISLSKLLFEHDVLPYYLHLLDKIQSAAHFEVPLDQAKQIHEKLKENLPGYLVPKLVFESAGHYSKCWV